MVDGSMWEYSKELTGQFLKEVKGGSGAQTSYVQFLYNGPKGNVPKEIQIESRDLTKLQIPQDAYGFFLFDKNSAGNAINYSPKHLIVEYAAKVMPIKEAIKDSETGYLTEQTIGKSGAAHVAETIDGYQRGLDPTDIVIDRKGNVIDPNKPAPQRTAAAKPSETKPPRNGSPYPL